MRLAEAKRIMSGLEPDQSKRAKSYIGQLSKDKDPKHWDKHMQAYLLENAKDRRWMSKYINILRRMGWNQSQYQYSMIETQLQEFLKPEVSKFTYNEYFQKAKANLMTWAQSMSLSELSYRQETDIKDALPKLDTHAGFSMILTGKKKKGQYLTGGMLSTLNDTIKSARKCGSINRPILIGTRTQASLKYHDDGSLNIKEFKSKTRLVSMIDIEQILIETKWAKPVQKIMSGEDWYAGGKNDAQISKILNKWSNIYSHSVTIDYSHYDQSIPSWLIWESFDIVRACFKHVDEELFKIMVNDFIHKVFIDGKGNLRYAKKGVPSGSMFTQIIDSIANRLMILSYLYAKQYKDYDFEMMIMGDDNVIFTNDELDMHELGDFLSRNYGITCHPDKCTKSHRGAPVQFLSRTWMRTGVYREPLILLSKLLAPERFRDYNKSIKEGTFDSKVKYEIMLLIRAYEISFPLGMKELINSKDEYQRAYWSLTADKIARSKLSTGLVQYLAKIEDKYSIV